MIAHTSLVVRDYAKSKAFYIQVLETLGYRNNMEHGEAAGFNDGGHNIEAVWFDASKEK